MAKTKNKKVSKNVQDKEKQVTLDDIIELEGNKKDLELLQGLGDADDLEEYEAEANDFESEPINKLDIQSFIENLGLEKHRPDFRRTDEEKKKKKQKLDTNKIEESKTEEEVQTTPEKKSKKKKNKFKVQDDEVSSTTPSSPVKMSATTVSMDYVTSYQPRKYLLIKPTGKWYDTELAPEPTKYQPVSPAVEKELKAFANKLFQDESNLYKTQQESKKRSDTQWLKTVLTSGTLSDRVAALTVTVQNSPVHNMVALDSLVSMATKKGRREAMLAVDTLKELFLNELLPEKKLRAFPEHALGDLEKLSSGNRDSRDKRLILWIYEAQLKEKYNTFVKALQTMSHDNIVATKKKAVCTICELLTERPEAERVLLNSLVNKLGDPDSKVASLTALLLTKLVSKHPNMKNTVVQEVERLLYRPNVSEKAQYFGVCFLNQLVLSHVESSLASRLVMLYFSFFKAFIKKNEVDSKMMAALLTGVNRAYPYAKVRTEELEEQMNTLHKVLHVVQFNTALHALMLLYQVMDSSASTSDRYYMALYKKMLDPALKSSSKQAMFLNLLYKSMKKDILDRRVQAFMKRLLQICGEQNPTFICGALILLSEVIKAKPEALRLRQIAESWEEDEDEEHFEDVPDDEEEGGEEKDTVQEGERDATDSTKSKTATWLHRINVHGKDKDTVTEYDPLHRNPVYCRAEKSCVWELRKLQNHYHPSVGLFASNVLKGENISYPGDPLQDFTLIRFLDRFVFRNPKKKHVKDDEEEEGKFTTVQRRKQYVPTGIKSLAVNTEEFLLRGVDKIPADEMFFFRYFERQAERKKKKKPIEEEEEESDESIEDDEFDDYLDAHEKGLMAESQSEIDFANEMSKEFSRKKDAKKKGKKAEEDSEEEDDMALSDEEMELSEDEDLRKAFAEEMDQVSDDSDEEGGLLEGEDEDNWTDGDSADDEDEDEDLDDGFDEVDEQGFNEEDVEFSDDDDFAELTKSTKKGKKRQVSDGKVGLGKSGKKQKLDKGDSSSLFAAAEEFSHMIDNDASNSWDMTGSHAYSNKDNADVKQLKWEMKREREMRGQKWRRPKGGHKNKMTRNKGKRKGRK